MLPSWNKPVNLTRKKEIKDEKKINDREWLKDTVWIQKIKFN